MAVIGGYQQLAAASHPRMHPTTVTCGWRIDSVPGKGRVLTLETYGSSDRERPGRLSQTIQVTADNADELVQILRKLIGDSASGTIEE